MKQLKDYLHLYLGCKILAEGIVGTFDAILTKKDGTGYLYGIDLPIQHHWANLPDEDVKPILRPLTDMTQDEKAALVEEVTYNHVRFSSKEGALSCFDDEEYSKPVQHARFYVDEINWLRKRFFDVDRLIENGLAIDKTLNQ